MTLWLKVTLDEYELPVAVGDSLADLAKKIGTSRNTIASSYSHYIHSGKRSSYRKVEIEEDDDE
jgi:hypothetical protein